MRTRHPWRWVAAAVLVATVTAGVLVSYRIPLSSDRLRREVIATLAERLKAQVELASIELRIVPQLRVTGSGLVIRHKRRPDIPLITVQTFTVEGDLRTLLRKHVTRVTVEGLAIQIPPGDAGPPAASSPKTEPGPSDVASQLIIDELVADGSTLTIVPREADKLPKVWRMHELRLHSVGLGQSMPFRSLLTNAVPPGSIATTGAFGPWDADDPGRSPVAGEFTFDRADLSVFKGISGTLAAHGSYSGSLGRIAINGQTDTPDFTVTISGHPVPLSTTYRAIVDGTSGDTTLERVDASFLDSALVAMGGVYDQPGAEGRAVMLDITMDRARLEDVLRLAVNTPKPTMTGGLTLQTRFDLPPGDVDVVEKLVLDGSFIITNGRFTNAGVQKKINTLSGRAQGKDEDEWGRVTSDFRGTFRLGSGRLTLTPVRFDVPGALVEVRGAYNLRRETLSFAGHVMMDAKVSQAVGGWKSFLLKPFDPLFRRNGRTFIPVTIGGTRTDPKFGLDVKRVFNRDAPPTPPKPSPSRAR